MTEPGVVTESVPEPGLIDLFRIAFSPPPGWDNPPEQFVPGSTWLPDPYWPPAPPEWQLWQAVGNDAAVRSFNGAPTLFAPDPDPVWVPAPGWREPPPGWTPPNDWHPDPTWPPAPPGWQFWHQPRRDLDADLATQIATRTDRLIEVNQLERWRLHLAQEARRVRGHFLEEPLGRVPNLIVRRRLRSRVHAAVDSALQAATQSRDLLLHDLQIDVVPGLPFLGWRRQLPARLYEFHAAVQEVTGTLNRATARAAVSSPNLRGPALSATWITPTGSGAAWQRAEKVAEAALRGMGHNDARVTAGGADGGLDVVGRGIAAQVKYTNKAVGRPVLQQLVGAASGRTAACFAASGFSAPAQEFADQRGIALFTIRLPNTVTAINRAAKQMTRR